MWRFTPDFATFVPYISGHKGGIKAKHSQISSISCDATFDRAHFYDEQNTWGKLKRTILERIHGLLKSRIYLGDGNYFSTNQLERSRHNLNKCIKQGPVFTL
jgi:hypothetical protein